MMAGVTGGHRLARRYRRARNDEIGGELGESVLVQRYLVRESATNVAYYPE